MGTMDERADLVIVGAGFYGLAAAKTYLQIDSDTNVILLDRQSSVGGVWAKERLYPGLRSNNMLGTYEFSDFPMETAIPGIKKGEHMPGEVMHEYLRQYAERFNISSKIRFNTVVQSVEKAIDGWVVTSMTDNEALNKIITDKLIIATGLTSEPFMPAIEGAETFDRLIFHVKDFKRHSDTLNDLKSVVVMGGAKSAWDTAYAYATAGVQVHMIIRESGHGPMWMAPPYVTPLKKWLEKLVFTRLLTWFSPCVWGDADGYGFVRRLLHGTTTGRAVVNAFWKILGSDVIDLNRYDKHPETAKLKPWSNPMFVGNSLSILNYPTDFFELVRNGQIKVHVTDVTKLSPGNVHLSSYKTIATDALICATGWKLTPPIKFIPDGMDAELGLPHHADSLDSGLSKVVAKADKVILDRFPRLRNQPILNPKLKPLEDIADHTTIDDINEPYRLYRFMIPPAFIHDRSIGFAGMLFNLGTAMMAQTQALWLAAYLTDQGLINLSSKSDEDIRWETVLHSQFGKWRYPAGYGAKHPDFVFDGVPYLDLLLTDLGLEKKRKGGMLKEWFSPHGPDDYVGLVDEWKGTLGQARDKGRLKNE